MNLFQDLDFSLGFFYPWILTGEMNSNFCFLCMVYGFWIPKKIFLISERDQYFPLCD
jgi:hypothetical protein